MNKLLFWVVLVTFPSIANASDPTPLIEMFVEWPLFFLSIILCFFSLMKLKNSLVSNLLLLVFHMLVLWWLITAGYMKSNGDIIWISLTINIIGIGLGVYKIKGKSHTDDST